ncbi:MAG: hypothetical protein ABSE39_00805 [Candidatus Bathyarchaeia archaeon]|jgi:hypothetical protein
MAHVAPIRISKSKTKTGRIVRLTIPKILVEDAEFPLNLREQVYIRIVPDGLLITHNSKGNGTWKV